MCVCAGGDVSRQRYQLSHLERGNLLHWAVSSYGSTNQSPGSWWRQNGRHCPGHSFPGPAADFWPHQERYNKQITYDQWYNIIISLLNIRSHLQREPDLYVTQAFIRNKPLFLIFCVLRAYFSKKPLCFLFCYGLIWHWCKNLIPVNFSCFYITGFFFLLWKKLNTSCRDT